jgi:hypothetical protein
MADQKTSYCLINKLLEWGFGSNFQRNFGLIFIFIFIFAPRFFPPRLAASVISALRLAMTSLHQVGKGNFSLKLSDMLDTHEKGRAIPHPCSSARNQ